MAVDYIPVMGDYKTLQPFRYWCQKVLPLVYDDSLSYYELLCKVVDYLNKTMEDVETLHEDVEDLHTAYTQLQTYVNNYFDNLDVQEEINNKLNSMASDGTLSALLEPYLPDIVGDWLSENITPTTPAIDSTLTVSGAGADAKVTGDTFDVVRSALSNNSFNVLGWENGAISDALGTNVNSSERIRSKSYLYRTVKHIYSTLSTGRFALYAYQKDGTFVGVWHENANAFDNQVQFLPELNMDRFYSDEAYKDYIYRVVVRISGGSIQIGDDTSHLKFDTYIGDFPWIESSINSYESDISKLATIAKSTNLSKANNINSAIIWESGSIDGITGNNVSSSSRVRTKEVLPTNINTLDFGETSTTRGAYIYAYDLDDNYIGAYKASTKTFVLDNTYSGFITEYSTIDLGAIQRMYPNYRLRICAYVRNSGSDITVTEATNWAMTSVQENTGSNIKVVQYNIGKFNMGNSGGLSQNVEEKILNYKKFFARTNADFVCLQEYTEYIDSSELYPSDATLFTPIYKYNSYYEHETTIKGQRYLNKTRFTYLHTSGDNPAFAVVGETVIDGKRIAIVSGALNSSAPSGVNHQEQGIRALTKLVTNVLANYDYAIIGMDCNCLNSTEADAFKTYMEAHNYISGNWDYLGYVNTYNLSSSAYKAIDNVFVTNNMRIVNFEIADVYSELSSDHFPVIAEIRV